MAGPGVGTVAITQSERASVAALREFAAERCRLFRPRSPEATASRQVAERLSDRSRAGKTRPAGWSPFAGIARIRSSGGRRSASELSPASQPFLPAPGLPGRSFGPAPSITSQTIFTLHGADDGRLGPKARPARADVVFLRRPRPYGTAAYMLPGLARKAIHWRWPWAGPVENRPFPDARLTHLQAGLRPRQQPCPIRRGPRQRPL